MLHVIFVLHTLACCVAHNCPAWRIGTLAGPCSSPPSLHTPRMSFFILPCRGSYSSPVPPPPSFPMTANFLPPPPLPSSLPFHPPGLPPSSPRMRLAAHFAFPLPSLFSYPILSFVDFTPRTSPTHMHLADEGGGEMGSGRRDGVASHMLSRTPSLRPFPTPPRVP